MSACRPAETHAAPRPRPSPEAVWRLTPVARLPFPVILYPVDDALVVANSGPRWRGDPILGVVNGNRVEFPDSLAARFVDVGAVAGSWPDDLDVLALGVHGDRYAVERWHRGSGGWSSSINEKDGPMYYGTGLVGGAVVMLSESFESRQAALSSLRGRAPTIDLPPLAPSDGCDGQWRLNVKSRIELFTLGSVQGGGLVAVGRDCRGAAVVARWPPSGGAPALVSLAPAASVAYPSNAPHAVAAGERGDAWIAMGFVAHVEPGRAAVVKAPPDCTAVAFALGRTWLLCAGGLFVSRLDCPAGDSARCRGEPTWRAVQLPLEPSGQPSQAVDIAVFDGRLWLASRKTLWRIAAQDEAAALPEPLPDPYDEELHAARPDVLSAPGGAGCAHNAVLLFRLGAETSSDYPFPRARRALHGRSELASVRFAIAKVAGERFLAGLAPTALIARELADAVARGVRNAAPFIACVEPEIVKDVSFELAR